MYKKSLFTLTVLGAALWGSFCLFYTRHIFVHQQSVELFTDKNVCSCLIETKSIEDVLKYVKPNALVVFDIDNTIAAPSGEIGTDQYSSYLIEKYLKEGMSYQAALDKVLPLLFQIQDYVKLYPLEKETLKVLDYLRAKKIPTVALTSRSIQIAQRTIDQLAEAGIVLQAPLSFARELSFAVDVPALYKDNIIFCAKNDKGKALMNLLKQFNYSPDCIIYVDDRISHIFSVEKECLNNHIRYIGIRYGYCDERVKNFDPIRAQQEYEQLIGGIASLPAVAN
jgi:FMN phosphatase YigB (HAD superfamily)